MASDSSLLSRYERLSEGKNLASATGNSGKESKLSNRLANLQGKIDKRGLDVSGLDIQDFGSPDDFNPADSRLAMNALSGLHRQKLQRRGVGDIASAMNRFRTRQFAENEAASVRGYQDQYMPSIDAAGQRADQLAQQDSISATEEAAMRSRIAALVKGSEATRMARTTAALGMANAANSPAAAAIANMNAQEADRSLVSSLSDNALQVAQVNEQERRANIDLATRIASMKLAIKTGNSSSLSAMNTDMAALLDALYSRERTMDLQWASINAAGQGMSGGQGAMQGAMSGASAGAAFGPWGALIGGVVGGVGGYASAN